jgi:hypothetical protein
LIGFVTELVRGKIYYSFGCYFDECHKLLVNPVMGFEQEREECFALVADIREEFHVNVLSYIDRELLTTESSVMCVIYNLCIGSCEEKRNVKT